MSNPRRVDHMIAKKATVIQDLSANELFVGGAKLVAPPIMAFGDVYYVDSGDGNDSYDGTRPDEPFLTPAAGVAAATDGNDDVLFLRGNFSDAAFTVDKEKLHIIGLGCGRGLGYETRLNSGGSASGATILIQARDVEIANLQVIGNRDAGKHYPAIFADGDNGGTRSYIHDCFVPMLTPSSTKYCNGINLLGDRHVVERVTFDSQKVGIRVFSQVQATYEIMLLNNIFYACDVGIHIESIQQGTGQHSAIVGWNTFAAYGAYAQDRAIKVSSGAPLLIENYAAGYSTMLTKGSAKLILNYNDSSGGTKET